MDSYCSNLSADFVAALRQSVISGVRYKDDKAAVFQTSSIFRKSGQFGMVRKFAGSQISVNHKSHTYTPCHCCHRELGVQQNSEFSLIKMLHNDIDLQIIQLKVQPFQSIHTQNRWRMKGFRGYKVVADSRKLTAVSTAR